MPDRRPAGPRIVLFLHRGGDRIRGTEEVLLALLAGIDREAFCPVVLCSDPVLVPPLEAIGVEARVHDFPEILVSRRPRLPLARWLRAARGVHSFARARGAEAIVSNGGGPCQLAVPVARWMGIPAVCWLHHPAPAYLHRSWLTRHAASFVFSSRFTAEHTRERTGRTGPREEGLGLATLQASACGLAAIGSDGTGVRETVEPGRTGLLFPVGDAEELAAAMLRLGRDPALRERMGRAGREMVLERFSPERSREGFQAALAAALSAEAGRAGTVAAGAEAPCHA